MPLPPGMARTFEAAGKRGCDCMAWSRKRRTVFINRQSVYESPHPTPDFGTKCPKLVDILIKKQMNFSFKIEMGGKPVEWFGWLCYSLASMLKLPLCLSASIRITTFPDMFISKDEVAILSSSKIMLPSASFISMEMLPFSVTTSI